MKTKTLITLIFVVVLVPLCFAVQANNCCKKSESVVEDILKKLNEKTSEMKTYQAKIQWTHTQPLFETVTVRKGDIYYFKDSNNSKLRINFKTLKTDDSKEQKRREDYLFDGVWLRRTDYQNKTININQLAPENAPVAPFEMVSRFFPILGFSGIEDLKKQFKIEYVKPEKKASDLSVHLSLIPKSDSLYKDDYTQIDFWIADKIDLPAKIVAHSSETDIFEISFSDIKINKKIKSKIFKVEKLPGFSEDTTVLEPK